MKIPKTKRIKAPLELIDNPSTIDRMEIDLEKVAELARSIAEVGLLQPVLLRHVGERYEVVAGHRRVMACKILALSTIDAVVRSMDDQEAAIVRATENLARENLTPVEEAVIFGNLIGNYKMTVEKVAEKFGYNPGTVRRRMDINKMPPVLRDAIQQKRISVTVAEELWPISNPGDLDYYLSFALDHGCTKDVARSWCKEWRDAKRRKESASGEGASIMSPSEPRPVYVACDLCTGPMEIGQEIVLRLCKACYGTIKQNMQEDPV